MANPTGSKTKQRRALVPARYHPRVGRLRFGAIRIPEKWSPPLSLA